MKRLVIVLSPRKNGTSGMLAQYIKGRLKEDTEIAFLYPCLEHMEGLLQKIADSKVIIMVGPCYVDSFPAHTIFLLEQMAQTKGVLHGQSLYGFIQGGMPYVHTHENGLRLLQVFAKENDIIYKGGFVMGGGAMLDGKSLDHIINAKTMVPAVDAFIECIRTEQTSERELYTKAQIPINGILARAIAALLCHNIRKNYKKLGIDYKAQSPYM